MVEAVIVAERGAMQDLDPESVWDVHELLSQAESRLCVAMASKFINHVERCCLGGALSNLREAMSRIGSREE